MRYADSKPGSRYRIEFPDGEGYICTWFTDYESENTGDLDIEMDDPRYDGSIRSGSRSRRHSKSPDHAAPTPRSRSTTAISLRRSSTPTLRTVIYLAPSP